MRTPGRLLPANDSRLRRRVCTACFVLVVSMQREASDSRVLAYVPEAMRGMETASLVRAMCPRASEPASERPVLHLAEWYESVARLKAAHVAKMESQLESTVLALPNGLKYNTTFPKRLAAELPGAGRAGPGSMIGAAWKIYREAGKNKK